MLRRVPTKDLSSGGKNRLEAPIPNESHPIDNVILRRKLGNRKMFRWRCFPGLFCPPKTEEESTDSSSSSSLLDFAEPVETSMEAEEAYGFVYPPRQDWSPTDNGSFRLTSPASPSVVFVNDEPLRSRQERLPAQPHRWHQSYLSPETQRVSRSIDESAATKVSFLS